MIKHPKLDKWILALFGLAALAVIYFSLAYQGALHYTTHPEYEARLFDDSKVQTIDIIYPDWDGLLAEPLKEEYHRLSLVINGERFDDVALRTKGNNSLRLTEKHGHRRFSLKIKFDEYLPGHNYYGLDKFSLDSSFQDNAYLKSFFAYDMMRYMGVATPLTSYVWVTVNGQPWGLFLAVEEPEEAFARRNYGVGFGQLYKPDYKRLAHDNADVHLRYVDDEFDSYDNIWRKAKFNVTPKDKRRLIASLKTLASGQNLDQAVDIEQVLRYFVPQVFVVNIDSYLGPTGHNYFLYEQNGRISMLPWDYNLAFGTYPLGMPEPINDARKYVNFPIDTPGEGSYMRKRPLFHQLMLQQPYHQRYRQLFDQFIAGYFESGRFEVELTKKVKLISPYVAKDPTAFITYDDYLQAVDTFKAFNLLRAKSVRGQLNGSVPATNKSQRLHNERLIEVGDLWLPDMGEIDDLRNGPNKDYLRNE